jgi:RNA polymerase sigma-70 factor (ECF subfamily)
MQETVSTLQKALNWDDATLVRRTRASDPFAENAIFRRHAPYLLNLATRLMWRMNDADDVVQETFIIAFRKIESLNDPEALRSWLIRILMSQIRKSFRVRRLKAFFGMDSGKDDATLLKLAIHDARPELRAELSEIDAVLQKTPANWRNAWMLHRIEGMSISETSQAVSRSKATVKRYVAAVDTVVRSKRRGIP